MENDVIELLETENLDVIVKKVKYVRLIESVTGEPRITLLKELKVAGINKGDRAMTLVPKEGLIIVRKIE